MSRLPRPDLRAPATSGSVVAPVTSGGGGKQALVARLLASAEVIPVDDHLGRRAGVLLGRSGTADAVDASGEVVTVHAIGDEGRKPVPVLPQPPRR